MSIEAKDLIKLVKACRTSGVSSLKIGDVEIKFKAGDAAELPRIAPSEVVNPPSADELKEIEKDVSERQELSDMESELDHMLLENPVLYEELLVQRELEGGGS